MSKNEAAPKPKLASEMTRFEHIVVASFAGLLSRPKDPENPCAFLNYPDDLIKEATSNAEILIKHLDLVKK